MEVELTDHLGYEPHHEPPGGTGNTRNGSTPKTLVTEYGPVPIDTPRDRDGRFQPKIVRKRQRRFVGFTERACMSRPTQLRTFATVGSSMRLWPPRGVQTARLNRPRSRGGPADNYRVRPYVHMV